MKQLFFTFLIVFVAQYGIAQCETWIGAENRVELEGYHSIYKGNMETEDYKLAFEYWQKVYKEAPAADGKRDSHYTDGVEMYRKKLQKETDPTKKEEYAKIILRLYDEAIQCYENGVITVTGCNDKKCVDEYIGYLLGRKGYDQYYEMKVSNKEMYETFKSSILKAGNKTEYFVPGIFASLLAIQVSNDAITVEEAREMHTKINEIVEYNIVNNKKYSQYFKDAKAEITSYIAPIETKIYDCAYFKKKYLPEYQAHSNNAAKVIEIYEKLVRQGCPQSDEDLMKIQPAYEKFKEELKQKELKELAKTNPEIAATLFVQNEEYDKAAEKYKEAIKKTNDPALKAEYYFRLASIQGRNLHQYSNARQNAIKAAELKNGWGSPYMLIGDLYASTARNCGDSWNQRLAILAAIDKYAYAKSIDSDMSVDANKRINAYSDSKPTLSEAHQRGIKEGEVVSVGCWIGENVKLRF